MLARSLILLMLTAGMAWSAQAQSPETTGQDAYISDELYTFMHAGPGRNYRILGSVTAGAKVKLLEADAEAGYSKIYDIDRERDGWVKTEFVSDTPSLHAQVPELKRQLEAQSERVEGADTQRRQLQQRIATLERERNTLSEQVAQVQQERDAAVSELATKDSQVRIQWLTRGGIIALVGLLLGVIIMLLPRKRKRRDQWM